MSEPLTQREFELWREGDAEFKQQLLAHVQEQVKLNISVAQRLSTVEAKQEECENSVSRRTTWISSLVAAAVGGVVAWWTGGMR